jgi:hypothetical protein
MAALIGFGQIAAMFLTSSTTAVMVLAVLPDAREGCALDHSLLVK